MTADEEEKTVDFIVEGDTLEIDSEILHVIVEPLLHLLADTDSHVRYTAAESLGKLGDKRALPHLQNLRQRDKSENFWGEQVRAAATTAIERLEERV